MTHKPRTLQDLEPYRSAREAAEKERARQQAEPPPGSRPLPWARETIGPSSAQLTISSDDQEPISFTITPSSLTLGMPGQPPVCLTRGDVVVVLVTQSSLAPAALQALGAAVSTLAVAAGLLRALSGESSRDEDRAPDETYYLRIDGDGRSLVVPRRFLTREKAEEVRQRLAFLIAHAGGDPYREASEPATESTK